MVYDICNRIKYIGLELSRFSDIYKVLKILVFSLPAILCTVNWPVILTLGSYLTLTLVDHKQDMFSLLVAQRSLGDWQSKHWLQLLQILLRYFYQKLTCIKTLDEHSFSWTQKIIKADELNQRWWDEGECYEIMHNMSYAIFSLDLNSR